MSPHEKCLIKFNDNFINRYEDKPKRKMKIIIKKNRQQNIFHVFTTTSNEYAVISIFVVNLSITCIF